jgi:hypothetical protein
MNGVTATLALMHSSIVAKRADHAQSATGIVECELHSKGGVADFWSKNIENLRFL